MTARQRFDELDDLLDHLNVVTLGTFTDPNHRPLTQAERSVEVRLKIEQDRFYAAGDAFMEVNLGPN